MSQKRKAQELPPVPIPVPEPAPRFCSGFGASVRNNTLEQLLLQGLAGGQEEGPLSTMRSNTMESILRGTLSGGRELQDLLLEWNHSLPEEKFVEGLASDMQAIEAAPPDVLTMRRTFTLERILSGAESDLANMLRANQQQHQHQVVRQQSGATAAAAAAAVGGEGQGPGEAGQAARLGGGGGVRAAERLQRQESLHRLASSSGPNQQPRQPGGTAGPTPHTQPHSHSRGPGAAGGLLHGSGRYGGATAVALVAAEADAGPPRSPKRHKLLHHHHHIKAEGGAGMATAPERTWSQSLLDLAKAAAALDGKDLDDDEDDGPGGGGGGGAFGAQLPHEDGGEGDPQLQHQQNHQRQQQQQQLMNAAGGGRDGYGAAAAAAAADAGAADHPEGDSGGRLGAGGRGAGGGAAAVSSSPGGGGAAVPGSLSAAQLLTGMKAAAGGQSPRAVCSAGGGAAEPPKPSPQETNLLLKLRADVERLQRDNEGLNGQLEAVLSQADIIQQKNSRMKQMLLDACRAKGIQADMELLNVSLQHHRAQPMGEAQATHVAATVLGLNGGDVLATVQHLIGIALLRISEGQGMGQGQGQQYR